MTHSFFSKQVVALLLAKTLMIFLDISPMNVCLTSSTLDQNHV